MIIPNIWEHKKWQPNHQPDYMFDCRKKKLLVSTASTQKRAAICLSLFWDVPAIFQYTISRYFVQEPVQYFVVNKASLS